MHQKKPIRNVKKPAKQSRITNGSKPFDAVLAAARKKPMMRFTEKEVRDWIDQFIDTVRPCLRYLYECYGVRPDLIFTSAAIFAKSSVPRTFPERLRNGRGRERTAALLERTATVFRELRGVDFYGVKLFSDAA